jgi:hypothetical protein
MFDNCLTNSLKLKQPQSQLTGLSMNEQTINTREFLRNYKKIITANETVIISNHGKPEGVFMPYLEWEKKSEKRDKSKYFTMEELEKYTKGLPTGGPTDTSQKIDEILYKNYKSYKSKK